MESEQQRSERSLQQRALQVWSTTVKAMQHNAHARRLLARPQHAAMLKSRDKAVLYILLTTGIERHSCVIIVVANQCCYASSAPFDGCILLLPYTVLRTAQYHADAACTLAVMHANTLHVTCFCMRACVQFKYLNTPEERAAAGGGVTADGVTFFATHQELTACEDVVRRMLNRIAKLSSACFKRTSMLGSVLAKKASAAKSTYFSMWAAQITGANQRIVGFNASSDITLLPTPRDCTVLPDQVVKPYEPPARGLSHLPPLPPLPSSAQHSNSHTAKQPGLFALPSTNTTANISSISNSSVSSSSKQKVRGPADCGTWVIPHLVLLGEFPVGTAKAQQWQCSKRSSSSDEWLSDGAVDTAAALLQAGVGVYYSMVSQAECAAYEQLHNLRPMQRYGHSGAAQSPA
eukprot:5247-Heterococcus_DN1.PRE.7